MGKNKVFKYLFTLILGIFYIVVILFSWESYPGLKLWKRIDISVFSFYFKFTLFRIIHLVISLPFFICGIINVINIIKINRLAQSERNKPNYIIMDGYYSKMRHPMYCMIVLIQASLFFSLCSALGIIFSVFFLIVFMSLGLYEEKYQLMPTFGENYKQYKKDVKIRFFPINLKIYLISIYLLSFTGLFF